MYHSLVALFISIAACSDHDDTALLQRSQVLRHKADDATQGLPEDVAAVSRQLPDGTYLVVPAENMGSTPAPAPPPPPVATTTTPTTTPPGATGVMRLEIVRSQHKNCGGACAGYTGVHELTAYDAAGNQLVLSSVCVKNTYETSCAGQNVKVCSCNRGWSVLSELTDGDDNRGHCFHLGANACSNSGDKCCDTWIEFQSSGTVARLEWLQLWDSSAGPWEANWVVESSPGKWTRVARFKQVATYSSREVFSLQAGAGADINHVCPSQLL